MPWSLFLVALGLMFVFEGILPFLAPTFWRRWIMQMLSQSDRALRVMGLVSMILGLCLVLLARYIFA